MEWLRHLWRTHSGRLSFQVLQEFYVTVTRKLTPGLDPETARADVRSLLAWNPVLIDATTLDESWGMQDRFGVSFWDALILAAARVAGCETILSEDLQEGQEFDGLRVISPFSQSP